jgi:TonB family protein
MKMYLGLMLAIVGGLAHAATFEQAYKTYTDKRYETAMNQFLELAELGNTDAQLNIGIMYARGEAVEQNLVRSYAWLKLSRSKHEKDDAADRILNIVLAKLDDKQLKEAERYLAVLDQKYGYEAVRERTEPKLVKGSGSKFVESLLLRKTRPIYPSSAASHGIVGAALVEYTIGPDGRVMHPFVTMSTNEVFDTAALAAIKGNVFVPSQIGGMPVATYSKRKVYAFDLPSKQGLFGQAEEWMRALHDKALQGGSAQIYQYAIALRSLGIYLPIETLRDFGYYNTWLHSAAVNGLPAAKYQLGSNILYGEQCYSDFDKSYFWLESAAKDGIVQAQMLLGLERLHGVRYGKDVEAGLTWLGMAAERYDAAKVEYARAIIFNESEPDLDRLSDMLDAIDFDIFEDKISLLEVQIILARFGQQEKKEKRLMKSLKKEAKKLELPYQQIYDNILRVQSGQAPLALQV